MQGTDQTHLSARDPRDGSSGAAEKYYESLMSPLCVPDVQETMVSVRSRQNCVRRVERKESEHASCGVRG